MVEDLIASEFLGTHSRNVKHVSMGGLWLVVMWKNWL